MRLYGQTLIICGKNKGRIEPKKEFLLKYPKIIEGQKNGFSARECVKLYDTSLASVAKIRKMILLELQPKPNVFR